MTTTPALRSPRTEAALRYQKAVEGYRGMKSMATTVAANEARRAYEAAPDPDAALMVRLAKGRPLPDGRTIEAAADAASAALKQATRLHNVEVTGGISPRLRRVDERRTDDDSFTVDPKDVAELDAWSARLLATDAAYKVAGAVSDDLQALRSVVYAEERRKGAVEDAQRAARREADDAVERAIRAKALEAALTADPEEVAAIAKRLEHVEVIADDAHLLSVDAYRRVHNAKGLYFTRNERGRITKIDFNDPRTP